MIDHLCALNHYTVIVSVARSRFGQRKSQFLEELSFPNNLLEKTAEGICLSLASGRANLAFERTTAVDRAKITTPDMTAENRTSRIEITGKISVAGAGQG